jgi:restriction system protein
MSVPDFQTLMLPVLKASSKGEVRISEVIDQLASEFGLSQEQLSELLPSGKTTVFRNRVYWAKTYLGKADLIEFTKRGSFIITEQGKKVLNAPPRRIDISYLMQFKKFRRFREASNNAGEKAQGETLTGSENDTQTPDEVMRSVHQKLESALAQELLERIRMVSPSFFELLIVNLLVAMGYGGSAINAGRVLGRTGDDGVDGVIDQDALGLDRVYIQAKRYAVGNNIGPGAIRDFFGSLDRHKATKGLFVTTSMFSTSAKETAELLSKRIVLVDGNQLASLMIRHNVGCRIEETLYIKKIDEEFFE